MAIIAPVFAFLGRQLGRILTTLLGWASTMLFGRVPQSRQLLLALMTFGSLAWVALLVGVIVPDVGTFLIAFVPVPDFVEEGWIRLTMLFGAIVLPLFIGAAGILIPDAADRPAASISSSSSFAGYPLAFLLAFTLAFLAVVGTVRKVRSIIRRWSDAHVPIVVRPGGYGEVVDDLEDALDNAGMDVTSRAAPDVMSTPGAPRRRWSPAGASARSSRSGSRCWSRATSRSSSIPRTSRSADARGSSPGRARRSRRASPHRRRTSRRRRRPRGSRTGSRRSPTASRASMRRVAGHRHRGAARARGDRPRSRGLDIAYDEWEVLYRMRLQVERDLLVGVRVGEAGPGLAPAGASAAPATPVAPAPASARRARRRSCSRSRGSPSSSWMSSWPCSTGSDRRTARAT